MIKIAIFENEYVEVETAFKALNLLYYNNELDFSVYRSSQEFHDLTKISEFEVVFVDLDLSLSSKMDGYTLIKNILQIKRNASILILSASSKESILTKLEQKGLPALTIISKPVDYTDIYEKLKIFLPVA